MRGLLYHTGFQCATCGAHHATTTLDGPCPACGANLDALYDYDRIAAEVDSCAIADAADRSI